MGQNNHPQELFCEMVSLIYHPDANLNTQYLRLQIDSKINNKGFMEVHNQQSKGLAQWSKLETYNLFRLKVSVLKLKASGSKPLGCYQFFQSRSNQSICFDFKWSIRQLSRTQTPNYEKELMTTLWSPSYPRSRLHALNSEVFSLWFKSRCWYYNNQEPNFQNFLIKIPNNLSSQFL